MGPMGGRPGPFPVLRSDHSTQVDVRRCASLSIPLAFLILTSFLGEPTSWLAPQHEIIPVDESAPTAAISVFAGQRSRRDQSHPLAPTLLGVMKPTTTNFRRRGGKIKEIEFLRRDNSFDQDVERAVHDAGTDAGFGTAGARCLPGHVQQVAISFFLLCSGVARDGRQSVQSINQSI